MDTNRSIAYGEDNRILYSSCYTRRAGTSRMYVKDPQCILEDWKASILYWQICLASIMQGLSNRNMRASRKDHIRLMSSTS